MQQPDHPGRWLSVSSIVLLVLLLTGSAIATPAARSVPDPSLDERLYLGSFGQGYDGVVQVRAGNGSVLWDRANASSYTSVSQVGDRRVMVGYADDGDKHDDTGVRIINWRQNRTVWQWEIDVSDQRNSEIHDAEVLPNGNVLIADMDRERVIIVNRTTREITWQWHASEHYETPADPIRHTDWLHINDVDQIGDGRFLVSVRNANQMLVLKRGRGVVEVINRDRSRDTLFQQHNPQWLGGGRVLVADSENDRVVELARQPSGEWVPVWTATHAAGVRFDWPRDADRLPNGNTLITDTRNNRVVVINEQGETVWQMSAPPQSYETDIDGQEYPAGDPYQPRQADRLRVEQPFEGLGYLYGAVRSQLPLPRWFGEWQFVLSLAAVAAAVYGETARAWSEQKTV